MRRTFVALIFCLCTLGLYGQRERYGQQLPHAKPGVAYPIKVHISALHYRSDINSNHPDNVTYFIYADADMNGEKVELAMCPGVPFKHYKLPLGDYQARLLKDPDKTGVASPLFQLYELLLPNNTVLNYTVTGISE